jgi:hypothetical protein
MSPTGQLSYGAIVGWAVFTVLWIVGYWLRAAANVQTSGRLNIFGGDIGLIRDIVLSTRRLRRRGRREQQSRNRTGLQDLNGSSRTPRP